MIGIHHIHIWSIDGVNIYATMHIVTNDNSHRVKGKIRSELREQGINHATLELEKEGEHCHNELCNIDFSSCCHHHHH